MTKSTKRKIAAVKRGMLDSATVVGAVIVASSDIYGGKHFLKNKAIYQGLGIAGDVKKVGRDMYKSFRKHRNDEKVA